MVCFIFLELEFYISSSITLVSLHDSLILYLIGIFYRTLIFKHRKMPSKGTCLELEGASEYYI